MPKPLQKKPRSESPRINTSGLEGQSNTAVPPIFQSSKPGIVGLTTANFGKTNLNPSGGFLSAVSDAAGAFFKDQGNIKRKKDAEAKRGGTGSSKVRAGIERTVVEIAGKYPPTTPEYKKLRSNETRDALRKYRETVHPDLQYLVDAKIQHFVDDDYNRQSEQSTVDFNKAMTERNYEEAARVVAEREDNHPEWVGTKENLERHALIDAGRSAKSTEAITLKTTNDLGKIMDNIYLNAVRDQNFSPDAINNFGEHYTDNLVEDLRKQKVPEIVIENVLDNLTRTVEPQLRRIRKQLRELELNQARGNDQRLWKLSLSDTMGNPNAQVKDFIALVNTNPDFVPLAERPLKLSDTLIGYVNQTTTGVQGIEKVKQLTAEISTLSNEDLEGFLPGDADFDDEASKNTLDNARKTIIGALRNELNRKLLTVLKGKSASSYYQSVTEDEFASDLSQLRGATLEEKERFIADFSLSQVQKKIGEAGLNSDTANTGPFNLTESSLNVIRPTLEEADRLLHLVRPDNFDDMSEEDKNNFLDEQKTRTAVIASGVTTQVFDVIFSHLKEEFVADFKSQRDRHQAELNAFIVSHPYISEADFLKTVSYKMKDDFKFLESFRRDRSESIHKHIRTLIDNVKDFPALDAAVNRYFDDETTEVNKATAAINGIENPFVEKPGRRSTSSFSADTKKTLEDALAANKRLVKTLAQAGSHSRASDSLATLMNPSSASAPTTKNPTSPMARDTASIMTGVGLYLYSIARQAAVKISEQDGSASGIPGGIEAANAFLKHPPEHLRDASGNDQFPQEYTETLVLYNSLRNVLLGGTVKNPAIDSESLIDIKTPKDFRQVLGILLEKLQIVGVSNDEYNTARLNFVLDPLEAGKVKTVGQLVFTQDQVKAARRAGRTPDVNINDPIYRPNAPLPGPMVRSVIDNARNSISGAGIIDPEQRAKAYKALLPLGRLLRPGPFGTSVIESAKITNAELTAVMLAQVINESQNNSFALPDQGDLTRIPLQYLVDSADNPVSTLPIRSEQASRESLESILDANAEGIEEAIGQLIDTLITEQKNEDGTSDRFSGIPGFSEFLKDFTTNTGPDSVNFASDGWPFDLLGLKEQILGLSERDSGYAEKTIALLKAVDSGTIDLESEEGQKMFANLFVTSFRRGGHKTIVRYNSDLGFYEIRDAYSGQSYSGIYEDDSTDFERYYDFSEYSAEEDRLQYVGTAAFGQAPKGDLDLATKFFSTNYGSRFDILPTPIKSQVMRYAIGEDAMTFMELHVMLDQIVFPAYVPNYTPSTTGLFHIDTENGSVQILPKGHASLGIRPVTASHQSNLVKSLEARSRQDSKKNFTLPEDSLGIQLGDGVVLIPNSTHTAPSHREIAYRAPSGKKRFLVRYSAKLAPSFIDPIYYDSPFDILGPMFKRKRTYVPKKDRYFLGDTQERGSLFPSLANRSKELKALMQALTKAKTQKKEAQNTNDTVQ